MRVICGFPSLRPVRRNFNVFFDLRLSKRLSKQSRRRWFETPSRSLWRHCNVKNMILFCRPRVTSEYLKNILYCRQKTLKESAMFEFTKMLDALLSKRCCVATFGFLVVFSVAGSFYSVRKTVSNRMIACASAPWVKSFQTGSIRSLFEMESVQCPSSLVANDGQGDRKRLPRAILIGVMKSGTGKSLRSVRLSVCPSIHPSIHPFIHPSIHLSSCSKPPSVSTDRLWIL